MERITEPELMDGAEQAEAYAIGDFAAPNQRFVELFREKFPTFARGTIADLGCGPADIPIRLCRALPEVRVVAVDGARAMLAHAEKAVREARMDSRIELVCGFVPGALAGRTFDAVISNSVLHHLPDPMALWSEVRAIAAKGAPIAIIDLMRPKSREDASRIVETYSAGERPILKEDFFNSLLAAFRVDEVRAQLERAELSGLTVEAISDRHLFVSGRASW